MYELVRYFVHPRHGPRIPQLWGTADDGHDVPVPPLGRRHREIVDFLAIGALGFVVDVGLFNVLLLTGAVAAVGEAKVLAATAATMVAYVGHRTVTWRHCVRRPHREQLTLFVLLNTIALSFSIVTLLICHHWLGLSGPVVDNVAANGVGLLLGGGFRFVGYRVIVFAAARG